MTSIKPLQSTDHELSGQFVTFYVGDLMFGVDVMQVQEIIRYQEMTPVPLSSEVVEGLINLRGQIITAIDLRRRLGLESLEPDSKPMNVVVRSEGEVVSFLVDRIGDVIEVESQDFEHAPTTLDDQAFNLVKGVYKLNRELLLALDVKEAADVRSL
ncbi:MAG: chemotaxis protein CheW [Bdellovibrionales bacterium]|nr:chemotaxis protein CheW [Bdellovibrionales bacterium]